MAMRMSPLYISKIMLVFGLFMIEAEQIRFLLSLKKKPNLLTTHTLRYLGTDHLLRKKKIITSDMSKSIQIRAHLQPK